MALGPGYAPPLRVVDENFQPRGPTGGDGGGEMLEARVKGLEDDMKEVKKDLVDIKVSLSGIHGELKRIPGFVGMGLLIGAIVGLNTIAQIAAKAAGL